MIMRFNRDFFISCTRGTSFFSLLSYTILGCLFFGVLMVMPEIKNGLIVAKGYYLILFTAALLIVECFKLFLKKKGFANPSLIDVLVIVFFGYIAIRLYFTPFSPFLDLRNLQLFACGILYLILRSSTDQHSFSIIAIILMAGASYEALLGINEVWSGKYTTLGVKGSFSNSGPYAGYLASILPVAFGLYFQMPAQNRWSTVIKWTSLLTIILVLTAIPLSLSRSAWVAACIGIVVSQFHQLRAVFFRYEIFGSAKIKLALVSVVLLTFFLLGHWLFYFKEQSASGRLFIWKVSSLMITDNLAFGLGVNRFSLEYPRYQANYFKQHKIKDKEAFVAGKGEYAFNEYIAVFAELGAVGLVTLLLIIILAYRGMASPPRVPPDILAIQRSCLGGMTSILVFAFFSYPFAVVPILLNFFVFLSIICSRTVYGSHNPARTIIRRAYLFFLLPLCIGLAVFLFQHIQQDYRCRRDWQRASELSGRGSFTKALKILDGMAPTMQGSGEFMFEYGQILAVQGKCVSAICVLEHARNLYSDPYLYNALGKCYQAENRYSHAEAAFTYSYYLIPHKFYPLYLLAKLYIHMGQIEKAKRVTKELLVKEIKVPSSAIEQMKMELCELLALPFPQPHIMQP